MITTLRSPVNIQYLKSKWFFHALIWAFIGYFSFRFFVITSTRFEASLRAFLSVLFSAATFYFAFYFSYNLLTAKNKSKAVFKLLCFAMAVAFTRTISIISIFKFIEYLDYESHSFYFLREFLSSVLYVSCSLVFGIFFRSYELHKEQAVQAERQVQEKLRAELNFLKNQINPHFLFNVHNSIYFLINDNPEAAAKALLTLSEIMRFQLYECNENFIQVKKELETIVKYVELEKLRFGKRVKIDCHFPPDNYDLSIPPFVFLTLAENSFKHISNFERQPNYITLTARMTRDVFEFTAENTTEVNLDPSCDQSLGIGLKNLLRRLELLYGDRYESLFLNRDGIFYARLKIPIRYEKYNY